jgi:hypothetical protein
MKEKNNIILCMVCILWSISLQAQEAITGTISNYTMGEGVLSSYDMVSMGKIDIGKIDHEGNFNLPLDADYLTTLKEQAEKAKANAPKGWQIKFKTVATTFECFGGELEYQNGEALIAGIPDPEVTAKDGTEQGILFAVSQPEMAQWLYSYGQKNSVKGYYLQWFYVEETASVNGECIVQRYTGNDEENYNDVTITNLELKKGWNIIKFTIAEVFTDKNGHVTPSKMEVSNISELPDDIQWVKVMN